uniref:CRAL-TRIO domain-containing protein n=1 Tax=Hanusia phi TaxID=3032 RepID=A0A7S0HXS1_9CRYP|mmetsp:Transcript_5759/g.13395  ORF Transcript_5759/g.13395 Transcript_5759/m.13395 type:complete len:263 (+) Transcript_5759:315-1103(+)
MKGTIQELQHEVESAGMMGLVEKHRGSETADDLLNRFLLARRSKVKDAFKMLKHDLEWREKEDSLTIRSKTAREMLRGDTNPAGKEFHDQMFPHGYLGTCKMGRPVFYQNFGRQFDADKLEKVANIKHEDLARYNIWMMERLAEMMNFQGQWVIIVDLDGWNLGQLTLKHMKYVRQFVDKNSNHYPERAGKIFLINVPSVFSKCWSMIKPLLDDVTKQKVGLYSSPEQWKVAIEECFDLDLLPKHLGGNTALQYDPHSMDPL